MDYNNNIVKYALMDFDDGLTHHDFDGLQDSLATIKNYCSKFNKRAYKLVMGAENEIYAYQHNENSYASWDDIYKTIRNIMKLIKD